MIPNTCKLSSIALLLALVATVSVHATNLYLNDSEKLSVIKKWLPSYHSELKLIFEYHSEDENSSEVNSKRMHRAIDRAGPTITVIEALAPYDEEPRTIGGYNPYKWKTWLGRYESNAGRFIFDVDKVKKWERSTKLSGSFKASPMDYGLSFGNGDLVIHPDLGTGSARNKAFAPPSNNSVLLGQGGDFQIKSIRVYRVLSEDAHPTHLLPFRNPAADHQASGPSPVPDSSNTLFEIFAFLTAIAIFKRIL